MPLSRVEISVPGKPRGWQRSGTADGHHYVKKETAAEQAYIRQLAARAMAGEPPMTGPIAFTFEAVFEKPTSWSPRLQSMPNLPHVSKPDLDNIEKLLLDALNGVAWADDAQVCQVVKRKRYGEGERVDIVIEELATTVDHPAVRRAVKRQLEDTVTPRTARKKQRRTVRPAVKEQPIGKRLK
jgi:Holliday junction resolvase RusA-like endonuclease